MSDRNTSQASSVSGSDNNTSTGCKPSTAKELQEQGNKEFYCKSYEKAYDLYSQAIILDGNNHVLYGNRSATSYQLRNYLKALDDATIAVDLAPEWVKGYTRKALAHESLLQWTEAISSYEKILALESDIYSLPSRKASHKIQQLQSMLNATEPSIKSRKAVGISPIVTRGFLSGTKEPNLYIEKRNTVSGQLNTSGRMNLNEDQKKWEIMLSRMKKSVAVKGNILDNGVFAELLQPETFRALVYPGIPLDQIKHAPSSLVELLEDEWYESELLGLMPKVQSKAEKVLYNVKKKGAACGDIMDPYTEQQLQPQILQEAFAREVLAMVHRVNYKKHLALANDERTLADPDSSEYGSWNNLSVETLSNLINVSPELNCVHGVGVMDNFMGAEWTDLLISDASRMSSNGLLPYVESSIDSFLCKNKNKSNTTWKIRRRYIEQSDCSEAYPVLAEIMEKLHALPYEINAKCPLRSKLCISFPHCTALNQLGYDEEQKYQLDCGVGDKDNGFKVTCIYVIGNSLTTTSSKRITHEIELRNDLSPSSPVKKLELLSDRLILFKSNKVFNKIVSINGPTSQEDDPRSLFYLTFWIHGKEFN